MTLSPNPFQAHLDAADREVRRILFLDLETRSQLDIRKVDAETYAAHPSTEIMCASAATDMGPILRWTEEDFITLPETFPDLMRPDTLLCFHNAEFEAAIFKHKLDIILPVDRIVDSAAVARHAALPGGLDDLAQFFGGEKDKEGRKAMLKLSKPRKPSKANPDPFWTPLTKQEDFDAMYTYCDWDVHWTREAMLRMPPLSKFEQKVYAAVWRMNRTGLPIDIASAHKLNEIVAATRKRMSEDTLQKHGFTLTQPLKIAEFLGLPDVSKHTIRDYLKRTDMPPEHRHVALARQTFAKTSVDKIKQMIARSTFDGRVHGGVIYGAAERTLRFAGAGVQPQNFPRGMGEKQDLLFESLMNDAFELLYEGEELQAIADAIRGLIKHSVLNVGDYSQIEARMLAWLVGDTELLQVFADGGDPYKVKAAEIYHIPVEKVTPSQRFMGKQSVLGCLETSCKVLTDKRGWVPIHKVKQEEKLWDGVEWVSHQGVLFSGMKPTIRKHGVGMTSDHLVFLQKKDGSLKTQEWSSVLQREQDFQSALSAANLPSSGTRNITQTASTGAGTLFVNALAGMNKCFRRARLVAKPLQPALDALACRMRQPKRSDTQVIGTSLLTTHTAPAYSTASQTSFLDAQTRTPKPTNGMGAEESGVGSKIVENFSHTLSRLKGGMTLIWSLIGSTTTGTTNPGTSVLSLGERTTLIVDQLWSFKSKSPNCVPVYDIAHAGPRNRFMVLTNAGPLIVHNCGYGIGWRGFQTLLDVTYDVQIEEAEAQEVVDSYRRSSPKVKSMWRKMDSSLRYGITHVGKTFSILPNKVAMRFVTKDHFWIRLPSGRKLHYRQVQQKITSKGSSWSCFGRLKSGAGYGRVNIYGGALTGHITQSTARDVIADAMVRLDQKSHQLCLTVHDELVSLDQDNFAEFQGEMLRPPEWLTDFPLAVDAFQTERYRK